MSSGTIPHPAARGRTPAADSSTGPEGPAGPDRRAAARHPLVPGVMGVTGGDDPAGRWPVIVQDVSAGGVGLLIGRPVEAGAELRLALGGGGTVRARVVRVGAKAFGHWFHGCAFAEPLPADTLATLLRLAGGAAEAWHAAPPSPARR